MSVPYKWGTGWDDLDDVGCVATVDEMAPVETWQAPATDPMIPTRFAGLVAQWKKEVGHLSSLPQRITHPAYAEIISLGKAAIPLLLRELDREPNDWFYALRTLTHDNPVKPEQRGNMEQMARAWVDWGRKQGYPV